jgi:hypothetical protein
MLNIPKYRKVYRVLHICYILSIYKCPKITRSAPKYTLLVKFIRKYIKIGRNSFKTSKGIQFFIHEKNVNKNSRFFLIHTSQKEFNF